MVGWCVLLIMGFVSDFICFIVFYGVLTLCCKLPRVLQRQGGIQINKTNQ